jgi:hypothetical protein
LDVAGRESVRAHRIIVDRERCGVNRLIVAAEELETVGEISLRISTTAIFDVKLEGHHIGVERVCGRRRSAPTGKLTS